MSEPWLRLWMGLLIFLPGLCLGQTEPVALRLLANLTPQELATFRPAL